MTKDFITLEQEAAIRELGYDEPCVAIFKNPLKSQVFRWFREKYNADFYITRMLPNVNGDLYHIVLNNKWAPNDPYKNYEDAESRLVDNLIEVAKYQNNE